MEETKEKVSFDHLVKKLGFGEAFIICEDILIPEQMKTFSLEQWDDLRRETFYATFLEPDKRNLLQDLAIRKMIEMAESFKDWATIFRHADKNSDHEKAAKEKMFSIGDFTDWTKLYSEERGRYASEKIQALAREVIKSFIQAN